MTSASATNIRQSVYNKYSNFAQVSYNCITYLIENNEMVWKLLKYDDADAWKDDADHPDLTKAQKGALIYAGQKDETQFRVFSDIGQDQPWEIEACTLRIHPVELYPTNHIWGELILGYETYSHYAMNTLSNYETRIDRIIQELLKTFNGAEVENIGRIFFDDSAYGRSKVSIVGQIPWKGKAMTMCTQALGQ